MLLDESVEPYMWDDNFLRAVWSSWKQTQTLPASCSCGAHGSVPFRRSCWTPASAGRSQTLGAAGSAAAPKSSYPERLMPHTRPSKVLRCVPGKNQL